MNINEIRQKIENTNNALLAQMKTFEDIKQEYINEIKVFIPSALQKVVEKEVKDNSEHTKSLDKEKLSQMKNELLTLVSTADNLVDTVYGVDELWMHINYQIISDGDSFVQQHNNVKKAEKQLLKGRQILYGYAGKILSKYNYIIPSNQYQTGVEWKEDTTYGIVYGYGMFLPSDIEDTIKKYCKNIETLHKLISDLNALQKDLSQQEALDLWDNA